MSHVDDKSEPALNKARHRFRVGKPPSPKAANDLLKERLKRVLTANGNDYWGETDFLPKLQKYKELCLKLECGALPAEVIRGVFDRLAFGLFQNLFQTVPHRTGVSPNEILGDLSNQDEQTFTEIVQLTHPTQKIPRAISERPSRF